MYVFLGVIFFFWLSWKLLRWWIIRKMRRQANDMFERFAQATGASSQQSPNASAAEKKHRKAGWQRAQHAKKITPDEGEYVEYEEVKISIDTTETDGRTTTETHTEIIDQQIVDVEWEDLK